MSEWLDFHELVERVQELIEYGLIEEANQLLIDYSAIYENKWEFHFLFSRICSEQNKHQEAILHLENALICDKNNLECLLGMFYAYSMINDFKTAEKFLHLANDNHPDNETVHSTLVWYHTETNLLEKAIFCFQQYKKTDSTNPDLFRNGGIAYQRNDNYDNAELCFKRALELDPDNDELRDLLADHYILVQEHLKAISLYQDALKKSPRNIRLLSKLAFCYSQSDQMQQASSIAKEIIRLYPNTPAGYLDLAFICINSNKFDDAIMYAKKAMDISPINSEAYRIAGIAYSEKNDFTNAENAFQTAISYDEKNTDIIRDYYHHLKSTGQFTKMEELVHTAIRLDTPYCIEDYLFLAELYLERNQHQKAFHYLKTAYKSMPGEKDFLPPIIDILLERGHLGYSVLFLMKYVKKKGWNDVMYDFARHRRLRGKMSQEGVRFLRFTATKDNEYHKYIFSEYLKNLILLSSIPLVPALILPVAILFGIKVTFVVSLVFFSGLGLFFGVRYILRKKDSHRTIQ